MVRLPYATSCLVTVGALVSERLLSRVLIVRFTSRLPAIIPAVLLLTAVFGHWPYGMRAQE